MIEATTLKRVFKYSSLNLPDPDPSMSPLAVRDFYASSMYAELASATVDGPEFSGESACYSFVRAVRDKG